MSSRGSFLLKADLDAADGDLRSLRSEEPPDGPPPVDAVVRALDASGLRAERIEPATRGTFHWVIPAVLDDGRDVVVRVNRFSHPDLAESLAVDVAVCRHVGERGVPAPAAIALDTTLTAMPAEYAIFERAKGVPASALDGDETAACRALSALGGRLRMLHEIALPGAGPLQLEDGRLTGRHADWSSYLRCRLDDHIEGCMNAELLDAAGASEAEALFAAPLPDAHDGRLLHGDPGPANVLIGETGSLCLLDWEDALVGDPLFDLAAAALFHPERRWPALFAGYFGTAAATPQQEHGFWLYFLRIALARTVMRLRFGIADLPGRAPAAARIQRGLSALRAGAR